MYIQIQSCTRIHLSICLLWVCGCYIDSRTRRRIHMYAVIHRCTCIVHVDPTLHPILHAHSFVGAMHKCCGWVRFSLTHTYMHRLWHRNTHRLLTQTMRRRCEFICAFVCCGWVGVSLTPTHTSHTHPHRHMHRLRHTHRCIESDTHTRTHTHAHTLTQTLTVRNGLMMNVWVCEGVNAFTFIYIYNIFIKPDDEWVWSYDEGVWVKVCGWRCVGEGVWVKVCGCK